MRKNYFAKKFVAYSMAFAVAFSTLTVSPVFVKDAKASVSASTIFAGSAIKYKVFLDSTDLSDATGTVDNGKVMLSSVASDDLADGTTIKGSEFLSNSGLTDKLIYQITLEKASGKLASDVAEPNYQILDGVQDKDIACNPVKVVMGQKEKAELKVTGLTSDETYTWYKLVPGKGTFTYPELDANNVARNDVITYEYFTLRDVGTSKTLDEDDNDTTFDDTSVVVKELSVTSDNLGLYILVDSSKNIKKFFDVCEKTDLDAKLVKGTVYAVEGSNATIATSVTSSKAVSYTWYKGSKELTEFKDKSVLTVSNIQEADFGAYTCEVTDGITTEILNPKLEKLTVKEVENSKADIFNTITKVLATKAAAKYLPNGKVNLTTILPDGDYRYIWLNEDDNIVDLSTSDSLSYDSSRKSIVVTNSDAVTAANDLYKCIAVSKSVYDANSDIKNALKTLSEAIGDVEKFRAIETLRKAEKKLVTGVNAGNVVYEEDITLEAAADDTKLESQNVNVTLGGTVTLEAPTLKGKLPVGYTWENAKNVEYNVTGNKLTIDTIDQNDLGTITCTVSYCSNATQCADVKTHIANDSGNTATISQKINLVYTSDLTATGSNVEVREGQPAELVVTAKSTVVPTYQWQNVTETVGANDEVTVSPSNILSATKDTYKLATVTKAGNNYYEAKESPRYYYQCVVSDGINTIVVPVKITEVETFKVYENQKALDDGDDLGTGEDLYYGGLKGDSITLAPIVVASEEIEKELTYTWKKDGIAYSTDKSITVPCEDNPATYQLIVTEGTNPLKVNYNVKTLTEKQLQTATINGATVEYKYKNIYTGSEINPITKVIASVNISGDFYTYQLKEGTDYTVSLTDAINAGVSQFDVVLIGNFADTYKELTETKKNDWLRGTFSITRADNKVEIGDNTVVYGKAVQPKTVTNLGKGALTYTYYADKAATTKITAPTKVGTYYVKAVANATINYNEAESNVATVKVVPGKVKMLGTSRTASSVKLNWNKTTGATSYRVFYKAAGAKSYKVFKNTTATSMNVTGLASATTYTFAVKAYTKTAGYSTVYATKQTTTAPAKVGTLKVTVGSKKATIKFDKVARATGYQIYMAKGNGSYKKVATTKSLSFTKTGLAKGATYKFKVRAYKTVGSNTYYGAFSSAKVVKVK